MGLLVGGQTDARSYGGGVRGQVDRLRTQMYLNDLVVEREQVTMSEHTAADNPMPVTS
jgi:hypothetical protein